MFDTVKGSDYLADQDAGELNFLAARAVLLATEGCGKIYKTTSNGFASTGDGFNLAYQNGIPLQDMEFIQFHPTDNSWFPEHAEYGKILGAGMR